MRFFLTASKIPRPEGALEVGLAKRTEGLGRVRLGVSNFFIVLTK
jgi:hypothetical protein